MFERHPHKKPKGFENPTKTERRFFSSRLNELISSGVIEKITLTNSSTGKTSTQCIRLVKTDTEESAEREGDALLAQAGSSTQDRTQGTSWRLSRCLPEFKRQLDERFLKGNRTIQWQILEALDEAGPKGMTRTVITLSRQYQKSN